MSFPPDPSARLSVRDLSKRFGERPVLDGLDLDVDAGSVLLLTGRNGSGKTTLLRCIAGLSSHDGRIAIDGRAWTGSRADRRQVGYLPQALGLPEWATVEEVLRLFARLRGTEAASLDLPDTFLPPREQAIDALSGGQRQRVAIAVALLGRPRLLLLDEPAANLDESGREDLVTILDAERARGTSVLVAAPSVVDLNGLPDGTVLLQDGRIVGATAGPRRSSPSPEAGVRPLPSATTEEVAS